LGGGNAGNVSDFLEDAERAALRDVAHLLPAQWQQMIDVVAAPVPETPRDTVAAPDDDAAARLQQIEHLVVVMLENRSFDHMLGYLSLPPAQGGKGRTKVDGLTGPGNNVNTYNGATYPIHHLNRTAFEGEAEDPDHSGASVDEQLAGGGQGFVSNFARISTTCAAKLKVPVP
jgi:phospholipase C